MAQLLGNGQIKLDSGKVIQAQEGGWYDARRYLGGQLLAPGEHQPGQAVSQEVIAQTNPNNVAYVNQQRQKAGLSPSPQANQLQPTPQTSSIPSGSGDLNFTPPEVINLPKIYESLYANSGIRDVEAQLSQKTTAYNEAVAKIKDNPYLSEATMTGRLRKLDEKFNADIANVKNDIAMRKADIETQLNLQTKQFDINSEQSRQAFQQFQALLESGALDNASGEDIANLTRSTGLSSSMIQSAINFNKKKNEPKLTIDKIDDGTNIYAVAIDSQGNVVNRQVLGASEPKKGTKTGDTLTPTQNRAAVASATKALSTVDENEDKKVSLAEYKKAIQLLIQAQGITDSQADDYLTAQMQTLGYSKWRW